MTSLWLFKMACVKHIFEINLRVFTDNPSVGKIYEEQFCDREYPNAQFLAMDQDSMQNNVV